MLRRDSPNPNELAFGVIARPREPPPDLALPMVVDIPRPAVLDRLWDSDMELASPRLEGRGFDLNLYVEPYACSCRCLKAWSDLKLYMRRKM